MDLAGDPDTPPPYSGRASRAQQRALKNSLQEYRRAAEQRIEAGDLVD